MDLSSLNFEQRQAVEHGPGPLMVVAGAGTGKTQVIAYRIAQLVLSKQAKPHQILALTFTEKAAAEMESRVVELLGYLHDVEVMTFNSFGDTLLKRFGREIGLGSELTLLSEIQQNILVSDNLDSFNLKYFAPLGRPDKYIADMLRYFSKLKSELVKPQEYHELALKMANSAFDEASTQEAKKHLELAESFNQYTKLCRDKGFIDYDDQINLSIELLEKRPNIAKTLQLEIRYLLIDEFQDTNKSQNRLLGLLTNSQANITVVGDDDQSIYRFRGAAISNILEFQNQHPQVETVVLAENYRSSQQILDASYRLIQNNNPERLEFKAKISKQLHGQFEGDEPVIKGLYTLESEMDFIANDVKNSLSLGSKASSIAVLVRKNSQAIRFGRVFERAGIAHRVLGQSQNLYQQSEVQFMLYYFRFLSNPNDSASLYHLLAGDIFEFDLRSLRLMVDAASSRHITLEQLIRDGEFELTDGRAAEVITKFDQWRKDIPNQTVGESGFAFLEGTGYIARLIKQSEELPEVTLRLNHLNQYFKTLSSYEAVAEDKTVTGYVDHIGGLMKAGEATDSSDVDPLADEVQIMTVHRAKGLEFDNVYVFDLTQGNFPSRERGSGIDPPEGLFGLEEAEDDGWNKREERRLMYVAMTRAKKRLIMTFSLDHGGRISHKPSEFLKEASGKDISLPTKDPGDVLQQLELFRYKAGQLNLTPDFWQGNWLVLTVRQVDDYINCPAEFRWKYILKVPERVSANLAYGNLLHHIIERFNRALMSGNMLGLSDMLKILENDWPETGFFSKGIEERTYDQAQAAIKRFYQREAENPRSPKLVEDSFSAKIESAGVIVKGRYDAVFDDAQNGLEIRDYKSGGAGLETEEAAIKRAKESNQLSLYALCWQLMKGNAPDKLTLDFIDQGLVGSVTKTPKQLQRMEEKIAMVAQGIRNGDFAPGSSCFNCSHTNLYQENF